MQTRLTSVVALALLFAAGSAFAVGEGPYEILENGAGKFNVEINGVATDNVIREIAIDELNIDVREMTTGTDWLYRTYGPGAAHWGSITFTASAIAGVDSELARWWNDSTTAGNIRKNITIFLRRSDGTNARRYDFTDCFPVSYTPPDASSSDPVETLVIQPSGFSCDADLPDPPLVEPTEVLGGFSVELGPSEEGLPGGFDVVMEHAQGGAEAKEKKTLPFGDPLDPTQARLKGARFVTDITLKGPMTPSRKALCQWITDVVQGKPWKRTVTINEILTDGEKGKAKTYTYLDGFPVRYVFPSLDASATGNLYEEVQIKPIRLELK